MISVRGERGVASVWIVELACACEGEMEFDIDAPLCLLVGYLCSLHVCTMKVLLTRYAMYILLQDMMCCLS